MVRVVKEYDERHAEFLSVAQKLFYSKGYDQTSIQEIINAVGVAKGTFYHYFDSKAELLEELVAFMIDGIYAQVLTAVEPALADESISAVDKFEHLFNHIGNWKVANQAFVWESVRVFYKDENVLLRTKLTEAGVDRLAPLLARIISQGVAEGVFDVPYPEETARLLITINQTLSESVARLMLAGERGDDVVRRLEQKLATVESSISRLLGAPENALRLIDMEALTVWVSAEE
jgi:AcrR family transcriptional regulator